MTQPLALVCYEKLLPGSQLVNRLQDMGYRVIASQDCERLPAAAEQEKPLLVFLDLAGAQGKALTALTHLKKNPATNHLPVIAFLDGTDEKAQAAAREAGAKLEIGRASC